MIENATGVTGSGIKCLSCQAYRSMGEAQSKENRDKLPRCRGRFRHLDSFQRKECDKQTRLMLIGASNLWFPVVQSIIDMPRLDEKEIISDRYQEIVKALGNSSWMLDKDPNMFGEMVYETVQHSDVSQELKDLIPAEIAAIVSTARKQQASQTDEERIKEKTAWEPSDLLVPEWKYLGRDFPSDKHVDKKSGLTVHNQKIDDRIHALGVERVLAVDKLKKVNALIGFTRVDDFERANDLGSRLVRLTRDGRPKWVPATEDFGEGIFIQFDEEKVNNWERKVLSTSLWESHREAHRRNFYNRFSETAKDVDPDTRLPKPRYWLMHTLSHALIKRMAMSSGYGMASLTERLYAWQANESRPAAAGILIATTASDSDGTLGGLVELSNTDRFAQIMSEALDGMRRCSSDPVCAQRVPRDPEDFLHGAACHCCCMLSETSCERAKRFLDRRFLIPLPGEYSSLAFFGN